MEYQKIIDNTPSQPSKCRTKNLVEIKMTHMECTTQVVKLNLRL